MFTVLSNTRNSNLLLIGALAIVVITLLTLAIVPAVSAPQPALAPTSRLSEAGSDYYQRHPEVRVSTAPGSDMAGDFYLRHPEWASNVQNATIPVTGASEASDYFQRHPGLNVPAAASLDMADYFTRHPELHLPAQQIDLSDYFLRH